MNSILTIKNLHKNYHTKKEEITAIDNINLEVKKGEYLTIVGPSGCGKSTLLSIIANIDKPTSGEVLSNKKLNIGYMLQTDCLFPWLTILDNALLGLKINKKITKENISYVKKLLITYGLGNFLNSYPNNLSGGMRQRVALIRTLAIKPDILLLDEPFSALDYQTRVTVSDDVYKIIKETGITTIMVTHDIGESVALSDRVVILSNRPSTVKKIYEIKLSNKSSPIKNRTCKEFGYYYDMIWKEIDNHV